MHLHLHSHPAARITDARPSLSEDIRHRKNRYILTMGVRTLCVILAVVLWQVNHVAAMIAIACGAILPLIAVVYANAGRENSPGPPEPFDARHPPTAGPGLQRRPDSKPDAKPGPKPDAKPDGKSGHRSDAA